MAGFRKDLGNSLGNTALSAPRGTLGTGRTAFTDTIQTALYGILNPLEGLGKTGASMIDAVHNACTQGKWYKKLWKVPATVVSLPFMAVEGVAETLLQSGWNLFKNTRDAIANPFINFGNSIKSLGSSQPVGAFSFASINERSTASPRNRLAAQFA